MPPWQCCLHRRICVLCTCSQAQTAIAAAAPDEHAARRCHRQRVRAACRHLCDSVALQASNLLWPQLAAACAVGNAQPAVLPPAKRVRDVHTARRCLGCHTSWGSSDSKAGASVRACLQSIQRMPDILSRTASAVPPLRHTCPRRKSPHLRSVPWNASRPLRCLQRPHPPSPQPGGGSSHEL